ncbi:hypothetical protein D934_02620 [Xylella fastidiosa subsp. sandyi Ann-1]|uniref:Uncharacterized protein n=1 Tax=Xylella fastidiosa subsp. sandyi Ann-1 TaxID=155920 RepID=A0A060H626_XYLFS|nr:hypothetical protein D934_02620 [Xylella fastidiosa subsp. sandyi Ann-1]
MLRAITKGLFALLGENAGFVVVLGQRVGCEGVLDVWMVL